MPDTLTHPGDPALHHKRFADAINEARTRLRDLWPGWSAMVLTSPQEVSSPGWILLPPGQWPPDGVPHILIERDDSTLPTQSGPMGGVDMMPIEAVDGLLAVGEVE